MRKTFKKLMMLPMLAAMTVLMPTACTTNDNPVNDNTTVIDSGNAEFNPTVLTGSSLYVADGVDADLHQAFKWGCGTETSDPAEGWVLVLNKLTDVSEEVLKKAIVDGGNNNLICLVNPVKAEIDAYAESHDWFDIETDNVGDHLFIYGFNSANSRYLVHQPDSEEGIDPVLANMNRAQSYYVHISGMLSDYAQNQQNGSKEKDNNGKTDMEDFATSRHYSVTYPFTSHHKFRELAFSDADYLDGSGTMTANYDVYMAHVYEGQPGAGDYYGVKMTAAIASGGMWKGKGWNRHGGTYVRWCGASCKSFYVESHLLTSLNANWNEDLTDRLMFTSGGFPSPSTTIGATSYQDKNSFSLAMSQTIGGEASKTKKTGDDETNLKGHLDLSFSESWTWEHTESRDISDVDIVNMTTNGNWAAWRLNFNNLPAFKWSEDYGYDIKNNGASRGTMDLQGSWLWYDNSGKDNEDRAPYVLCCFMSAVYEMQSFISTEADNKIDTWDIWQNVAGNPTYITLPKMVNTTGGHIKIKNNLPDGMSLSNIVVTVASEGKDKGKIVKEFRNSVANGEEYEIGFFNNHYEYLVTFKAGKNASTARTYKYIANPTIKLGNLETVVLNADYDFLPE